jgi:hypothetical protein
LFVIYTFGGSSPETALLEEAPLEETTPEAALLEDLPLEETPPEAALLEDLPLEDTPPPEAALLEDLPLEDTPPLEDKLPPEAALFEDPPLGNSSELLLEGKSLFASAELLLGGLPPDDTPPKVSLLEDCASAIGSHSPDVFSPEQL